MESPLEWAAHCQADDRYSYEENGVSPPSPQELTAISDLCISRGLEVFADATGLHVEKFP